MQLTYDLGFKRNNSSRRSALVTVVMVWAATVLLAGCSLFEDDPVSAVITGRVTGPNSTPVVGALVEARFSAASNQEPVTTTTDANGEYTLSFSVTEPEPVEVSVAATFEDMSTEPTTVRISREASARRTINLVFAAASDDTPPTGPSGTLSQIVIQESRDVVIRVRGSGGPESAGITFVAQDSVGRPLSANNAVMMRFRLGQNPGEGLSVNPVEVETNGRGEATAVVTSGTRSGVIQLVAEATRPDGEVVQSKPVRVTIHGGLPAQKWFTLGPTIRNIPGLVRFNEQTTLEVIVGDRYSNPVIPGTAVYFATSHGVIGGSTTTDADGQGSVVLRSANPLPATDGIAIVTAETAGEAEERVFGQTPVLFSGPTVVTVNPGTAGFGNYDMTVTDPLGNPLVEGTSISVVAEGTGTLVSGHSETTLDDTEVSTRDLNGDGLLQAREVTVATGAGVTQFPFSVSPDPESEESPEVTAIKITVQSPNGNLEVALFPPDKAAWARSGGAPASVRVTDEAQVQRLPSGAVQVRAAS